MITIETSGSFENTERFLKKMSKLEIKSALTALAKEGVAALASATPTDSGLTASSWGYEITRKIGSHSITWFNTNVTNGFPVAIMLQYGHGTGTGGYVRGTDYINPAIRPIFDKIAEEAWKVVTSA